MKAQPALLMALACVPWAARAAEPDAPIVLKMATVAPDGSPWARELKAFARNVETGTSGHVRIKWYFNGIAGDEDEQEQRIHSGQLDGTAAAEILSAKVSPSIRVRDLIGVFQTREELSMVMNRLQPVFEAEAHQAGFAMLGAVSLGPRVYLTRTPARTMSELRSLRLWSRDRDTDLIRAGRAMGLNLVPLPLSEAARAYDEGRVDGFIAVPSAALAFQWSVRARYLTDLRPGYVIGALVLAERALVALPVEYQTAIRTAGAALRERMDELGHNIDAQLLGGLLQKQGVVLVPVSDQFRAEFLESATRVAGMGGRFLPQALVVRVLKMLSDFRAAHGQTAKR
jgi:TRAP-type C4-dicarboxylate transport system substrate-binding protein